MPALAAPNLLRNGARSRGVPRRSNRSPHREKRRSTKEPAPLRETASADAPPAAPRMDRAADGQPELKARRSFPQRAPRLRTSPPRRARSGRRQRSVRRAAARGRHVRAGASLAPARSELPPGPQADVADAPAVRRAAGTMMPTRPDIEPETVTPDRPRSRPRPAVKPAAEATPQPAAKSRPRLIERTPDTGARRTPPAPQPAPAPRETPHADRRRRHAEPKVPEWLARARERREARVQGGGTRRNAPSAAASCRAGARAAVPVRAGAVADRRTRAGGACATPGRRAAAGRRTQRGRLSVLRRRIGGGDDRAGARRFASIAELRSTVRRPRRSRRAGAEPSPRPSRSSLSQNPSRYSNQLDAGTEAQRRRPARRALAELEREPPAARTQDRSGSTGPPRAEAVS